jgi:hypothetical protein
MQIKLSWKRQVGMEMEEKKKHSLFINDVILQSIRQNTYIVKVTAKKKISFTTKNQRKMSQFCFILNIRKTEASN